MIVAVTGTPGTGKTSVAEALADMLGYSYVAVNEVARRDDVATEDDAERDARAVDMEDLIAALDEEVDDETVLDGHLSHFYEADLAVVLRCHPDELQERLAAKGWDDQKVAENVEAERLDVVLQQAVRRNEAVVEVDTTDREADAVAGTVAELVDRPDQRDQYRPGTVTWELPGEATG